MAGIVRRRYLGGAAAALGGLIAVACGEPTVRYVGQPQAGPAGPAGPAGAKGETGAQGQQGAQGAQGAAAKAPVTLDFQHRWNGPAREPIVDEVIKLFEETNPGIFVETTMNLARGEGTSGGVPIAKILASIAAGQPPDCFMIHANPAREFAQRGALAWLDNYLKRDGRSLGELYFPAVLPYIQLEGKTYALSQTASGDNPYNHYNKDMLAAKGVNPDDLKTWQGLLQAARTLTVAQGDSFKEIGYRYPGSFSTWHTLNGGQFWDADGRKVLFNDAIGREALTHSTEAVKQVYGSWPKLEAYIKEHTVEMSAPVDSLFANGKLAISTSGPWYWVSVPKAAPNLNWGTERMPRNAENPQSKQTTLAGSVWTWATGAGPKNPDEAWLLERWMSQDEGHRRLMTGMGRATMYKPVVMDKLYYDANPGWDLVLETINAATPLPIAKGAGPAMTHINAVTEQVVQGELGVAAALEQAAEKAQFELDKAHEAAQG